MVPKVQEEAVLNGWVDWQDEKLVDSYWPGTTSLSGQNILRDDIVERLAMCGEHLEKHCELHHHVWWAIRHDKETGRPTIYGEQLLAKLSEIYAQLDKDKEMAQQQLSQARAKLLLLTFTL